MWPGYLAVGGLEVGNTPRALGYSQSGDCPTYWLKDTGECDTLADVLGSQSYDAADISSAPWFDPDIADTSSRFLGVYVVDMENTADSTRQAAITQRLPNGGRIGRIRRATRDIRVRAILTAKGTDALDVGASWLDSVLSPGACGAHGGACGVTDMEFFSACPPARRLVEQYTDWAETRRNLWMNPRASSVGTSFGSGETNGSMSYVSDFPGEITTARRYTATAVSAGSRIFVVRGLGDFPREGGDVTLTFRVRASHPIADAVVALRPSYTTATGETQTPIGTIPAGESQHSITMPTFVAGGGSSPSQAMVILGTMAQVGATLDVTGIIIERGYGGSYFDGDTLDTTTERYAWVSGANNSESFMEARTEYLSPEGDDTYLPLVDTYRRYFHDVACTSGPFTVGEYASSDGVHVGRLVEFTITAENPWMYGVTTPVDVPPTVPTVVQDIAYNLAPYPSAELAGPAVVAATNYATNPSVETNATGWAKTQAAAITAGEVVGGRVTGELAAVGVASYRSVFTAAGSSGIPGTFSNEQEVALGAGAGARYSINMWSAAVIMAGTPFLGDIIFRAYWRSSAGGTILRTDELGTVPANGGAISVDSILPPVGATHVLVRATAQLASWNAGTIVRLYSDALAVTNP